jgi:calcium permeable stress-gated cation channel
MLRRRIIGWVLIGLVCFFNTLPLAIISVLANLGTVGPSQHFTLLALADAPSRAVTRLRPLPRIMVRKLLLVLRDRIRCPPSSRHGPVYMGAADHHRFSIPVRSNFGVAWLTVLTLKYRYQGALTNSRLERAVVARYFSVLVISQLVVFTLLGVIFSCAVSFVWWSLFPELEFVARA